MSLLKRYSIRNVVESTVVSNVSHDFIFAASSWTYLYLLEHHTSKWSRPGWSTF